jgi:iron-sulfur cluster repair protein YtfE (RIC family)
MILLMAVIDRAMLLLTKRSMNMPERELSVENYKKLGLGDLEELYAVRVIPYLAKRLETIRVMLAPAQDKKDTMEQHALLVLYTQQFIQLYNSHTEKEMALLSALRTRQTGKALADVPQLLEGHREMRRLLMQISDVAEQCLNLNGCSSLQKLGYAHINNFRQDITRLFFLEEEYLFPRLPLLQQNK